MKKFIIYVLSVSVILVLGVLIGRGMAVGGDRQVAAPAEHRLTVTAVRPARQNITDEIDATGTLVPREDVLVMPQVDGRRVLSVHADVGDYVRAGQLLAVLDAEDLRIDLRSLRTEYQRANEEYARARTLQADQLVSREFLRQKQAAAESARSALQESELHAERTRVVAPSNGLVYRRDAVIGAVADSGVPLFRLVQGDVIEMQADVPESAAHRLRTGMKAQVVVAGASASISGDLRLVAPRVDGRNRTAEVRITLPETKARLVGTFAEARIQVGEIGGWVVPALSLQQDSQGAYLWQIDAAGRVSRLPVTVLRQTAEQILVRESLQGLLIVARAGALLQPGDTVKVAGGAS
ncbi:MAG: efflux RND transporter periplasmic adaptor subunit [Lysobacteraceae bacterium]|nr:MAG: efflux RND transporter periplasmic adaptor subunit [Xanthomonadaceae bacterium]